MKNLNKNSIAPALIGLILGFWIGFYWTNSVNRKAVKEAEDRAHQLEMAATQGSATPPDNQPAGQPAGQPGSSSGAPAGSGFHQHNEIRVEDVIQLASQNRANLDIQMKAGNYLYREARRFDEARECFNTVLRAKPNDYDAQVALGNISFDDNKFDDAARWYEKALSIKPDDPNVRTDLGATYYLRTPRQVDKAIENYRLSLKIDPNHVLTLQNLALALIQKKELAEATTLIDKLSQIDPQNSALPSLRNEVQQSGTSRQIPSH